MSGTKWIAGALVLICILGVGFYGLKVRSDIQSFKAEKVEAYNLLHSDKLTSLLDKKDKVESELSSKLDEWREFRNNAPENPTQWPEKLHRKNSKFNDEISNLEGKLKDLDSRLEPFKKKVEKEVNDYKKARKNMIFGAELLAGVF